MRISNRRGPSWSHAGEDRFPVAEGIEAIGLCELASLFTEENVA